jgi:hypothetical protein
LSIRKTLGVDQGATFELSIRVKDEAGIAQDLTGATALFTVHEKGEQTAYYRQVIEGDSTGVVSVIVPDEETLYWEHGRNAYMLNLERTDGTVERLLYGTLQVRSGFND